MSSTIAAILTIFIIWGMFRPFKIGSFQTKRWMFVVTILSLGVVGSMLKTDDYSTTNTITNNHQQLVDKVKTKLLDEPKIVDVMYQPNGVQWHVAVADDGSNRNGYASYICDVLKEHNLVTEDTIVRVVDISRVMAGEPASRDTSLGSMRCSTYQPFD